MNPPPPLKKQTQSCPESYPLSRNSTMEHSAGGESFPVFPSLTQLKSHYTQKEIKGRVRKRHCGL